MFWAAPRKRHAARNFMLSEWTLIFARTVAAQWYGTILTAVTVQNVILKAGVISHIQKGMRDTMTPADRAKPRVVHCKRERYDVYIGRPGKWGNPFRLESEARREMVVAQYRSWLLQRPELVADAKRELKGKILGCWCAPKLCHGDVLLEIANAD